MESFRKGSVLLSDDCKYNLAILYSQNGNEKSAISMYKQLYRSGHKKGCYNMGLLMEINNDESEAEKYYLKSCKSEFVKSQYRLAYLYDRKDKIEDAMEYYVYQNSDWLTYVTEKMK